MTVMRGPGAARLRGPNWGLDQQFTGTPRLLVACDFDGTLAPLVDDPATSVPLPAALHALVELATLPGTHVALVSGRSRDDLGRRLSIRHRFHLVGSHGAECGSAVAMTDDQRRLRAQLLVALPAISSRFPATRVEAKTMGAALHYRGAAVDDARRAIAAVTELTTRLDGLFVRAGKDVIDLSVVPADKGSALRRLRQILRSTAVLYAGDDLTDEDAFDSLERGDVGVKVGQEPTRAQSRVGSPAELAALLLHLLASRQGLTAPIRQAAGTTTLQ